MHLVPYRPPFSNPFEVNPALFQIWEPTFSSHAKEAFLTFQKEYEDQSPDGNLYVIQEGTEVIGVTGYFFLQSSDYRYVGLRWHGILPKLHGQGLGSQALALLIQAVKTECPKAQQLVEFAPNGLAYRAIHEFFLRNGFVADNSFKYDAYEGITWQAYSLNLQEVC